MASVLTDVMTADEFADRSDPGRCELVRGELQMMSLSNFEHGIIAMNVGRLISNHVAQHQLGLVFGAETGFLIKRDPDTVRAPDVAFLARENIPAEKPKSFGDFAPDIVVEVLSPSDGASYVLEKVREWLDAGTTTVWIIDPRKRSLTSAILSESKMIMQEVDALKDEQLLPGLSLTSDEVFSELD